MTDDARRTLIQRLFEETFNSPRLDIPEEVIDAKYVEHFITGDKHGVSAFREFIAHWRQAFPDLRVSIHDVIIEGDRAAWRTQATGTNGGYLLGIPATGKRMQVSSVGMARFNSAGKLVEHWTGNATAQVLLQLGLIEAMREPATA
jgi:predicted ester cyclase